MDGQNMQQYRNNLTLNSKYSLKGRPDPTDDSGKSLSSCIKIT